MDHKKRRMDRPAQTRRPLKLNARNAMGGAVGGPATQVGKSARNAPAGYFSRRNSGSGFLPSFAGPPTKSRPISDAAVSPPAPPACTSGGNTGSLPVSFLY